MKCITSPPPRPDEDEGHTTPVLPTEPRSQEGKAELGPTHEETDRDHSRVRLRVLTEREAPDEFAAERNAGAHRPARPKVRGDCIGRGRNARRPCPWVSCRHHLLTEITINGGLKLRGGIVRAPYRKTLFANGKEVVRGRPYTDAELDRIVEHLEAMPETCALDVADGGTHDFRAIADLLDVSHQATQQTAAKAISKVTASSGKGGTAEKFRDHYDTDNDDGPRARSASKRGRE